MLLHGFILPTRGEHQPVILGMRLPTRTTPVRQPTRGLSGGAIICAGTCVYRFSRTQLCVTLSSFEAEYVALGNAVEELFVLKDKLLDTW